MAPSQASAFQGWRCELCSLVTLPLMGSRHRCRTCQRTVCGNCSSVPIKDDLPYREARSCKECRGGREDSRSRSSDGGDREKYVFLVRHAQSTWNGKVDLVKTVRHCPFDGISMKDVVSSAAQLVAREVWHRDHPISPEGMNQIQVMRERMVRKEEELNRQGAPATSIRGSNAGGGSTGSTASAHADEEGRREHLFYSNFLLMQRRQIYCSPLLRALQTAHLLFPKSEWGPIKLLKDARERFNCSIQRDCLGESGVVGQHIVDRAKEICQEMKDLDERVDFADCEEQWWSSSPETESQVDARLSSLWRHLLETDRERSCVLVTHSNLIKALLMRFGIVDESFIFTGHHDTTRGAPIASGEERAERECNEAATNKPLPATLESAAIDAPGEAEDEIESSDLCDSESESSMGPSSWQVVKDGPASLQKYKVERLQNCGVLGLRCVCSSPQQPCEDEGFTVVPQLQWVAKDALLMFDSVLVN